jgi:hypothetical protein
MVCSSASKFSLRSENFSSKSPRALSVSHTMWMIIRRRQYILEVDRIEEVEEIKQFSKVVVERSSSQ